MRKINYTLLVLVIAVLCVTCKKDHRVLGTEVQPEDDQLQVQAGQNFPVYMHTVWQDSIVSLNTNLKFLGCNFDEAVGTQTVGLYMNLNITRTALDFKSATLRSAEILLAIPPFAKYTGVRAAKVTYSVFEMNNEIISTKSYFTNNMSLHDPGLLIGTTSDSIFQIGAFYGLRIPISAGYATRLLQAKYEDNDDLQRQFKGIYVTASLNGDQGVIVQYDLDNSFSGLYMKYANGPTLDSIFQFTFSGPSSAKFNTVKFDPIPIVASQLAGDTALGKQNVYLKGMGVTKVKVQIPFLKNYSDTFSVAVTRAEVIFNIDPLFPASDQRRSPPEMALVAIDSLGRESYVIDQRSGTYISRYDGKRADNNRYVFNIPLHAQAIMSGKKKNYGFYLIVASPTPPLTLRRDNYIENVILAGSDKELKPVFNISYTRFKND